MGNGVCGMFRSALVRVHIFYQCAHCPHFAAGAIADVAEYKPSPLRKWLMLCRVCAAVHAFTSGVHPEQNEVRSLLAHLFSDNDQVGYR